MTSPEISLMKAVAQNRLVDNVNSDSFSFGFARSGTLRISAVLLPHLAAIVVVRFLKEISISKRYFIKF